MGIFSALSGKNKHFNSIYVPIYDELTDKIKNLENGMEKLFLGISFDIAQSSIREMFNPDHGVHGQYIMSLTKENLQNIWNFLILYSLYTIINNIDDVNEKNLINNTILILNLDEHKINIIFTLFKDKDQHEQLIMLWHVICNQIQPKLDNEENYTKFIGFFEKIFNENYIKLAN